MLSIKQLMSTAAPIRERTVAPTKNSVNYEDPKIEAALAKKYAYLSDPSPLFSKITSAYGVLAGLFSHQSFTDTRDSFYAGSETLKQRNFESVVASVSSDMRYAPNIKIIDNNIVLAINLPPLAFEMAGLNQNPSQQQVGLYNQGLKLLSVLIPDSTFKGRAVGPSGEIDFKAVNTIPLETIAAINVPNVGKIDISSLDKNFRGTTKFIVSVFDARVADSSRPPKVTDYNVVMAKVGVRVEISYPKDYAVWATSSNGNNFVQLSFFSLAKRKLSWFTNPGGSLPPDRVEHPDAVAKIREKVVERYGFSPRPRVNKEGLCSVPSGEVYWIPEGQDSNYSNTLNSCVDPSTGDINYDKMANRHVGTDWLLAKMYVTLDNGAEKLIDLTGARPITPVVLGHLMAQPCADVIFVMTKIAEVFGVVIDLMPLTQAGEELKWENLIDVPFDANESSPINAKLFEIGKQLGACYDKVNVDSRISIIEIITLKPYFALLGPYAGKRLDYAKAFLSRSQQNRQAVVLDKTKPVQLKNMSGVTGVMPHQGRVDAELSTHPHLAVLDIKAGGGKSFAYIDDMTKLLDSGLVGWCGIAMPRNLMAQFAQEVIKFTHGRLRPFLINRFVWRDWNLRLGADPKAILQFLKMQPKNTVFIVDYDWLMRDARKVTWGEEKEQTFFFPHATLLAQLNLKYFACDESQKTKNLETSKTAATAILTSVAAVSDDGQEGYARIGTGTLVHNTAKDLIGQIAQLEPTALGNVASIRTEKRIKIADASLVGSAITAFARRVTVTRREWAHLLPPLEERVWPVRMTKKQQEFYNDYMKEMQAKVLDDPKIKKLMKQIEAAEKPSRGKDGKDNKKSAEEANRKIEAILKRLFTRLEVWINAPDSNFGTQIGAWFRDLSGVGPADVVSPKIDTINTLVSEHFNGSVDAETGKDIPPDANKIIIIGFNKAVSRHVFEHMAHKDQAVFYSAGMDKVIEKFKNDDNVRIIVGDATTLSEGHNLQMASRIIMLQSFWTPGMHEQLISRIQRPDVPDKDGKTKFKRDKIYLDWIVCEPSIEIAKMARLIGKRVEAVIITEVDHNKNLKKLVDDNAEIFARCKEVRMVLDLIKKRNLETTDALSFQFASYRLMREWEKSEFMEERKLAKAAAEQRLGRKVSDRELAAASMLQVVSKDDPTLAPKKGLQGSGYLSWVNGFTGIWNTDLNLVPLAIPQDEDGEEEDDVADEDMEDVDDEVVVNVGDPVVTAYGVGTITNARQGSHFVTALIPGCKKEPIKFIRFTVLAAGDEKTRQALLLMLKTTKEGLPLVKLDAASGKMLPSNSFVPEKTVQTFVQTAENNLLKQKKVDKTPRQSLRVEDTKRNVAPTRKERTSAPSIKAPVGGQIKQKYTLNDILHDVEIRNMFLRKLTANPDRSERQDRLLARIKKQLVLEKRGGSPRAPTSAPGVKDTYLDTRKKTNTLKPRVAPINLGDKSLVDKVRKDLADHRELHAILLNGTVSLLAYTGENDEVFLKNGFDRVGKSIRIRVKNPKAYVALIDTLASKFYIPRMHKRALDEFADVYAAKKTNIAFSKARELTFHRDWLKDQRSKAKEKGEIRPWPVVEDGYVYVYISLETSPYAAKVRTVRMPVGVVKPEMVDPSLVCMVRNKAEVKQIVMALKNKNVVIDNIQELKEELTGIRG